MKSILVCIFMIIVALIILYSGYPIVFGVYNAVFNPLISLRIEDQLNKLPTSELIRKVEFNHPLSSEPLYAMQILGKRREKKALPILIKNVYSWNPDRRYQAISALGQIGDSDAVPVLLEIVENNKSRPDANYHDALFNLSEIGYEPIRPIVLNMLKQADGARNGATSMLRHIGKSEDLPLLESMLSKIKGNDVNARLDRSGIMKAIEAIKLREGIK